MTSINNHAGYRWYLLALAALTDAVVVAIPTMALSVLFHDISADLELSLVQVGVVWGIGSLSGIVIGLFGGAIGDHFGPRRILMITCLLAGLAGGMRGLSQGFLSIAFAVFLFGASTPLIIMNGIKICSMWFPRRQLGLANGVLSIGMALGFLIGSLISATWLSDLLGGWRNVFLFYGACAMILAIPWYFARPAADGVSSRVQKISVRAAMAHVAPLRNILLLGLTIMGISGCVQGTLGYLPLYLRGLGWPATSADGALAFFHTLSMIFVLPIALWSDRLGSRRNLLIAAGTFIAIGVGLLSVVDGVLIWVAVGLAGFVRDGFMALFMTMVVETDGVGPIYAGTATGFIMVYLGMGNMLAPPLGNSLAVYGAGVPFAFWATLTVLGLLVLTLVRDALPETAVAQQPANI